MPNPNIIPWLKYQDIQIPDVNLRNQFQQLMLGGNYSQALTLLNNNSVQLQGKAFVANVINIIINGINILENYWNDEVVIFLSNLLVDYQNLIDNFKNTNDWNSNNQYYPYNFVYWNKDLYMCFNEPPIGTLPSNQTYWLYLGLQGMDGAPGTNVNMTYDWNENRTYQVNDLVVYNGDIYVALQANVLTPPDSDDSVWLLFLKVNTDRIIVSVDAPLTNENNLIWFQVPTDPVQQVNTNPMLGQFYYYSTSTQDWVILYPNTVIDQVEGMGSYGNVTVEKTLTIQPENWGSQNFYFYLNPLIQPNDICLVSCNNLNVQIIPVSYINGIFLYTTLTPTIPITVNIKKVE